MKKLVLFLAFSFGSICYAGFRTDALNVTGSSITINGTSYNWQAGVGTAGQCLMTDGGTPPTLTWGDCGGVPTPTTYNYALLEDSTYLLLEDGTKMLLEH